MAGRHIEHPRAAHRIFHPLSPFAGRHAFDLDARDELQIFAHRHFRIERRRFRQIARAAFGFDRLVEDVKAGNHGLAVSGRHVAGQDAHGGGLPGAVGAQKAENFSALHFEGEVIDGRHPAVAFREVLNLNHVKILFE